MHIYLVKTMFYYISIKRNHQSNNTARYSPQPTRLLLVLIITAKPANIQRKNIQRKNKSIIKVKIGRQHSRIKQNYIENRTNIKNRTDIEKIKLIYIILIKS